MSKVEISRWETPFETGDIQMLDACYGNGGGYVGYPKENLIYEFEATNEAPWGSVVVRLFHKETETIYRLTFLNAGAFRVLDEHGLLEIWKKHDGDPAKNSFRVKNHGWSEESVVSFISYTRDGWAWMIASENECVEVLCIDEPQIEIEKAVPPRKVPADSFDVEENDEAIADLLDTTVLYKEHGEKF